MPTGEVYNRQAELDLKIPEVATVVGCGGTGFWTAVFLSMSGVEHLILIDNDIIETSNLNRLPVESNNVGIRKTEVLKSFIENIRSGIHLEPHEQRIEKPEDCHVLRGAVFCCTDNLKSQQLICAYSKKNNLKYQRIGYDGTVLNVSRGFPLSFKEEKEDEGGYTVTPSWVVPAAVAAGLGVFARLGKELCVMDDIGKLNIANSSYIPGHIKDKFVEEGEDYIRDNIEDHIPDGYGWCDDCSRGCCEDCDRIDVNYDTEYGYCPDCERPCESQVEEMEEEKYNEGYKKGCEDNLDIVIDSIKGGEIEEDGLEEALEDWFADKIREIRNGDAPSELIENIDEALNSWKKIQLQRNLGKFKIPQKEAV